MWIGVIGWDLFGRKDIPPPQSPHRAPTAQDGTRGQWVKSTSITNTEKTLWTKSGSFLRCPFLSSKEVAPK